jgi:hypothetical protein
MVKLIVCLSFSLIAFGQSFYKIKSFNTPSYANPKFVSSPSIPKAVIDNRNLYFTATYFSSRACQIVRTDLAYGQATVFAGQSPTPFSPSSSNCGYSGDGGPATAAKIDDIEGMAFLGKTLYLGAGSVLRSVDSSGIIHTVTGFKPGYQDGPFASALFGKISAISPGWSKDTLLVADSLNHAIRLVDLRQSLVTTIAGKGMPGFFGDGDLATSALLNEPRSVRLGLKSGEIFVADSGNQRIRLIDQQGFINTVAGGGQQIQPTTTPLFNMPALDAYFDFPVDILSTPSGLAIVDLNVPLLHFLSNGEVNSIAGQGTQGSTGDGGLATKALICPLYALAMNYNFDIHLPCPTGSNNRILTGYWTQTFRSNPAGIGARVTVNAITFPMPYSVELSHTFQTPLWASAEVPLGPGARYGFTSWSHGGLRSQLLVSAPYENTYTANYQLQYLLSTTANLPAAPNTGAITISGNNWYPPGTPISLTATVLDVCGIFDNWSGTAVNTTQPTIAFPLNSPVTQTANFRISGPLSVLNNGIQTSVSRFGSTFRISVTNNSGKLIRGPISVYLQNLGQTYQVASTSVQIQGPLFSSGLSLTYFNLITSATQMAPGETYTFSLFASPNTFVPIVANVLACPGNR